MATTSFLNTVMLLMSPVFIDATQNPSCSHTRPKHYHKVLPAGYPLPFWYCATQMTGPLDNGNLTVPSWQFYHDSAPIYSSHLINTVLAKLNIPVSGSLISGHDFLLFMAVPWAENSVERDLIWVARRHGPTVLYSQKVSLKFIQHWQDHLDKYPKENNFKGIGFHTTWGVIALLLAKVPISF